jgi:predicted alpha-1,2-mannosidase
MTSPLPLTVFALGLLFASWPAHAADSLFAQRIVPNLEGNVDRPLRYRPDGADFVIENGPEFFNRSLYGGDTAFRVDGGDRPEFAFYLPGRGGNLRIGARSREGVVWLQRAQRIVARYRPGELLYEIQDPVLGPDATLRIEALAYDQTEGLILRATAQGTRPDLELIWAYGGITGQRGARDGDIGTESVPISQYFQLEPAMCRGNRVAFGERRGTFEVRAAAATIAGVAPDGAAVFVGDARHWNDLEALLAEPAGTTPDWPLAVARGPITENHPLLFALQHISGPAGAATDLATYREVTADRRGIDRPAPKVALPLAYVPAELPGRFAETERHFAELRTRVSVDTPDPFLNAGVGALNVAADALWDEPQQAIMHGAIAWRTRLLGWRGPYVLDELGWHDRARTNALYWAARQNTDPIPASLPPADERSNLARNEAGLHTNGDISNSHYDMNLVFIDELFRHLLWTGDVAYARRMWPVIERHLAWERRCFRREYGPDKLPLYEAYAAIWASDNLQYGGGGTAHASAYNYYHNRMAARIAPLVGADPAPYTHEAELISRAMRELLWMPQQGEFAEYKDWLGRQLVHPSGALWTFYHTVDSELPTPEEAWRMTFAIDREIPHLPVRGPGVPPGLHILAESNWMPYQWSINNVVVDEAMHTALGFWQAGRPEEAWRIAQGSLLATMFMGISPGNVGTMSYLDVYRRESQRDFGDSAGTMSRAIVEGLFGIKPDALAGELLLRPGFPAAWDHASIGHPDLAYAFHRVGNRDTYLVELNFRGPQRLRLQVPAWRERLASVVIDGQPAAWRWLADGPAPPRVEIVAPAAARTAIVITWAGRPLAGEPAPTAAENLDPPMAAIPPVAAGAALAPVDLTAYFNDKVTQIFRNEYRRPRSPFVSLAVPKQGLGGWAGGFDAEAEVDDSGLRKAAAQNAGRLRLPNGVVFATPGEADAKNILFTSQWSNYPAEATVPLSGRAERIYLLMAGSTEPMQSRLDNGEVIVAYADGTTERLALRNPTTWWPIEQDYFVDDFQFRRPGPLPLRVDLATGRVRVLDESTFPGKGGKVPGGAATVLSFELQPGKSLQSLTVRTLANDVVIGLMSATLVRPSPANAVNPLIGTGPNPLTKIGYAWDTGNVFPGAVCPRGMIAWSPDTTHASRIAGGYWYPDDEIEDFSLTHFSGRGVPCLKDVGFLPLIGKPLGDGETPGAHFSHRNETARAGYYRVQFDNGIVTELTVTARTGLARFTYPAGAKAGLLLRVNGPVTVQGAVVSGYSAAVIPKSRHPYRVYFWAECSRAILGSEWLSGAKQSAGDSALHLRFASEGGAVEIRVGISYTSLENARDNLAREQSGWDFDAVARSAAAQWNAALGCIEVEGGTAAERTTFYTALYHCFMHPNLLDDANGQYLGFDGAVHALPRGHHQYQNIPAWDQHRSHTALMALVSPRESADVLQSLVNDAEQDAAVRPNGGGLPRWCQVNHNSGGMVGDGDDTVIATAYAYGVRGFDARGALAAMDKGASVPGTASDGAPVREGLAAYEKLGQVPGEASVTLEYCTDDFSLSRFAAALGDEAKARTYLLRAQNWRNLFDRGTGYLRPRLADGTWAEPFSPARGQGFIEGSAAQYLWMVNFDLAGLIDQLGGREAAVRRLDHFFAHLNAGTGSEFSYMGNEPCEEAPWVYAFAGAPSRTQAVVRSIETELYSDSPGGLPGNDDAGALSSWYVFSALGLYPELPGIAGFVTGSPLFPRAWLHRGNGRTIDIEAFRAGPEAPYVQGLRIQGKDWDSPWVPWSALASGAQVDFDLGPLPSSWGSDPTVAPPSFDPHESIQLGQNLR